MKEVSWQLTVPKGGKKDAANSRIHSRTPWFGGKREILRATKFWLNF